MASYSPEDMVADAVELLAREGATPSGFDAIGKLMQRLGRDWSAKDQQAMDSLHGAGARFSILAEGRDGSVLMLASFPPEKPTPPHDHGTWGIACVVSGRDRHIRWRRLDDGSKVGRANVEAIEDRILEPGDVVVFGPPPNDLHSQQGVGGTAYELVYFGRNPALEKHHYFDQEAGTVASRFAADPL